MGPSDTRACLLSWDPSQTAYACVCPSVCVSRYPAFKSHSLNVSKHVAIMSELSRLSTQQSLMDVSALEQELVCDDDITVG